MTRPTHEFATSQEAYDACQTMDHIKNGDTLVIKSERVVGVATTWPLAVTKECGVLHQLSIDFNDAERAALDYFDVEALADARNEAARLGFE